MDVTLDCPDAPFGVRAPPRILRLNVAGLPVDWVNWQEAVCLYSRQLVVWTLGGEVLRIRGGYSRIHARRSELGIHSIIACDGRVVGQQRSRPPLTNRALFRRDRNLCLYCGGEFADTELTRDHVVPRSRGGRDVWDNVVAACKRCNHQKGDRLPQEAGVELLALPYAPNFAEYLALINSGRILGDQMDFLQAQFGRDSGHHARRAAGAPGPAGAAVAAGRAAARQ
jgi:5-methylcytosine-specific restriction endonuclease McrA